jgi:hypothetical protein
VNESADVRTAAGHSTASDSAAGHSVGNLVKEASEELSTLVRQEVRLAQLELAAKGKRAKLGGGLFGGAGVVGFIGLQALAAAAIAALSRVLPVWAAALIVAGALLVLAAILALAGKKEISRATPPTPQAAIGSVKADLETIRERAHR